MRTRRLVLVSLASLLAVIATTVMGVAVNAATGSQVLWFPSMNHHPLQWLAGAILGVVVSGLLAWSAQRNYESSLLALVPAQQQVESWVVDRPAELGQISRMLRRRWRVATVGITTAVHGAGGFGKTTVARLVRADRRILRHFSGRVYWVTLGRDARRGSLVEKVNDLVRQIDPERAQPYADIRQAADHLAAVLATGPRRLLILDDVWFDDQLSAFPVAGRCARLITTRVGALVAGQSVSVKVDQMTHQQALAVLTADLRRSPPPAIAEALLLETGRWPLLLRLVNRILIDQTRSGTDVASVALEVLGDLNSSGVLRVDELTGADQLNLDIDDPDQRKDAISATIEASLGLLTFAERERFTALAIFVEDELVPVSLVASGRAR